MKRTVLTLILIFTCLSLYGQNTPIDLIVLLNTSSDMSSSYDNVNEYLTGSFLSEFLRLGDTFHLIAFSGSPRLDAARRISEIGDVETIIGRMLLQYPVESGNNVAAALSFAERYITSLPSRPKKIVLVSTGASDTNNLVSASRQRLNSVNATLDFVQVIPGQALTNLPRSGRDGASSARNGAQQGTASTPAAQSQTGTASTPAAQSQTGTASAPAVQSQTGTASTPAAQSQTGTASTPAAQSQTGTASTPAAQSQTGTASTPAAQGSVETAPSSQERTTSPDTGTSSPAAASEPASTAASSAGQAQETAPYASGSSGLSTPVIAGIIVFVLLLLGFIIFFAVRKSGSKDSRSAGGRLSPKKDNKEDELPPFADHSQDLAKYAAVPKQRTTPYADRPVKAGKSKELVINPTGPLILNLHVDDQNTAIGKRNIHSLNSGYSLTVGGGNSDFLIFLVPMPPNIGEIRRNGSQCTFAPKKPKYFPDLGSNELTDCINKTIRVVSDKKYEMRIRFEMYEDPLLALNRVLMSIKVPG